MAGAATEIHFFSIRRLNPFRGTIQIAIGCGCRGISLDGEEWELQIEARPPAGLWATSSQERPRFLRFGSWSRRQGLRQIPAHPFIDFASLQQKAECFLEQLQPALHQLPFLLADRYECWLLDGQNRLPLALLASATRREGCSTVIRPIWVCAERDGGDFSAPEFDLQHPGHPADGSPHYHISAMEHLVRSASGHPLAQWFHRQRDGSGVALESTLAPELSGRKIPPHQFPLLPVRETWKDCYDRDLTQDYLNWLAPLLLTLQNLPDSLRRRFERAARQNALAMDRLWRLYPKLLDSNLVRAARVEARLRLACA